MAIPTSITSGSNALWQQSQQAQRAADQAALRAQSLQAQAKDARTAADRAESDARALELKAGRAQAEAAQASRSVVMSTSYATMQSSLGDIYNVIPKVLSQNSQPAAQTPAAENTSVVTSIVRQNLGSVINTIA